MTILDRKDDKWAWYRCVGTKSRPSCGARTKQLASAVEVMHNCPTTKTMRPMQKEEG